MTQLVADPIGRIDSIAGGGIERLVSAHHRRRLARLDRLAQLDPHQDRSLWSAGDPRPRDGCDLRVLIDGEKALSAIAAALADARSHVHIAGWHLTPDFGLTRERDARRLRDLLGELAERVEVRVLLWAGAPLAVFEPSRRRVRRERAELIGGARGRGALGGPERGMDSHPEKPVVGDGGGGRAGGVGPTFPRGG